MPDSDLVTKISTKTKIYVLVAEAQEGELSTGQMAALADAMATGPEERLTITEAVLGKLVLVQMPSGRIEDLRNAFSMGHPEPQGGVNTGMATPADQQAADQFAKGPASQQTRAVKPAFKVPFESEPDQPQTPPQHNQSQPTVVQGLPPVNEAPQQPPGDQATEPPDENETMDTGQFSSDWADLEKSVRQAAVPKPPKPPKPPKGPLPVRGKAAQILQQGAQAAPPPPINRTPTQPRQRSSAEPVMRRDTMQFGGNVRSMPDADSVRDSSKPTVLVADDDARIRMVFRIKLEEKGFTVLEANNGADAWKLLQQGMKPHAVVLDMKMPGLHGLEVLQRISDSDMALPVVICTAYDNLDDEFVVATYPKLRYLTKPVDADQLAETLFNLLSEQ